MNNTQNVTIMEHDNSPERCHEILTSCLQILEEKNNALAISAEHLKSLTFFMGQFFVYSDLDPDSDNKDVRESSSVRIYHYKHYRNLFNVIENEIYKLSHENEQTEQYLTRAYEESKRITELRTA